LKLTADSNLGRNDRCIITNRTKDDDGFIFTNVYVKEQNGLERHVVISAAAAREAALMVGMYDKKFVEELQAKVEALGGDLADARESLDNLIQLNDLTQKVTA
jgi:hypothetical protein